MKNLAFFWPDFGFLGVGPPTVVADMTKDHDIAVREWNEIGQIRSVIGVAPSMFIGFVFPHASDTVAGSADINIAP